MLTGSTVTLRELRASDAPSLFALLTTEEVSRFISPPPSTVDGFEKFIAWTLRQRAVGAYACFAVTIDATDTAIGIFQLRQLEPGFGTAEWGFAIGSAYWGTGVFEEGANLLVTFAIRHGRRASARGPGRGPQRTRQRRAAQGRRRAGRAAAQVVPQKDGEYLDQALWTILDEDWKAKTVWADGGGMHHSLIDNTPTITERQDEGGTATGPSRLSSFRTATLH